MRKRSPADQEAERNPFQMRDIGHDPFEIFTLPPLGETPRIRAEREARENEAILHSKRIDAELRASKVAMKRHQKAVKVLVLGQSLSGKSTTIKNFQMTYARKSWSDERLSWKAVILLNIVRTVNLIIDVLIDTSAKHTDGSSSPNSSSIGKGLPTEEHENVILRLSPIRQIEKDLKYLLVAGSSETSIPSNFSNNYTNYKHLEEFCIPSSSGWKAVLQKIKNVPGKGSELYDVARHVLAGCEDDICWLWKHEATTKILWERGLRLEDSPGFFLNDIKRIVALTYEPSDEDILRARLRTTGVQEYHFRMDKANETAIDWIMYDVAGIRTARAAWVPYFKEATALIFLAPISGFNELLVEDGRTNRLEDTIELWKMICSSELLAQVQFILFMNKTDLLRKKLEDGIHLKTFIPEYKHSNDFETVSKWLRRVFRKIHGTCGPSRKFISHFTSVIDSRTTLDTLHAVQATILHRDIVEAGLI